MSDTRKRTPYNIFGKEKKSRRRPLHKIWRRDRKQAIRQGQEPQPEKRTSGWLTW